MGLLCGKGGFSVEVPFEEVFGIFDGYDEKDTGSPEPFDVYESRDGFARIDGVSFEVAHPFDVLLLFHRLTEVGNACGRGIVGCC